ncbi:MAG: SEC-C metal-binding domain-containing protein, partial [Waddliaceae bacterium]
SAHEKGRPILLGTESVDISEKLSRIFKQHNLPHTVLNAKNHEREAEIIAHAGQKGAITIATNMAGRGTDIKLGEGIADVGGLYVIGSTRHQSRRIDRQLRGRCARQGDPGSSKFFISFEDSLLRLFASPRMTAVLQRFRPPEGEPISAKLLNRSIETAQKRVEQRNYMMRKNTLEYDDVMNKQRQEMYAFRNEVLREADVMPLAHELIENVCLQAAQRFFVNRSSSGVWDSEGFRDYLMEHFPVTFDEGTFADEHLKADDLAVQAAEKITKAFEHKLQQENAKIPEEHRSQNPSNEAIRNTMIRVIDKYWQEHLLAMDHLRSDVNLRTIAQRDPLMEFKQESFILFDTLINKIYEEITHGFFRFELVVQATPTLEQMLSRMQMETDRSLIPELQETPASQNNNTAQTATKTQPVSTLPKVGRNDPCPCNSGQKYKRCCGKHLSE